MSTESNTVEPGGSSAFAENDWYRLLADERRQTAIEVLASTSSPIDLDVVATQMAVSESDSVAVEEGAVERMAIALHHKHLPLMDDLGVIAYDSNEKSIEVRMDLDQLTAW